MLAKLMNYYMIKYNIVLCYDKILVNGPHMYSWLGVCVWYGVTAFTDIG